MSGRFNLADYISVQERINQFWKDHPDGRIITGLESNPTDFAQCRYKAEVYLDRADLRPAATGWAFEIAGSGMANKTSHEENCETSAIGRALANLGYATSQKDRPSREEMHKASPDAPQARQQSHGGKYAHAAMNATQHAPQAATAPRAMNPANADEPATQPQIKAMFAIGRKLDIQVNEWVAEQFGGRKVDDLTRAEASLVMEDWQGELDKQAANQ